MSFFRSQKKCGNHKEKDLRCTEDVKVFPSQISEDYPSPYGQYGDWSYHAKKMNMPDSFLGRFDFMARRSSLSHQETNYTSLLSSISILDEHILHYAHLQNNKATTVLTCAISRLLPYRWQYRYVTTVLPVFVRNVFYGECSVFI